MKDLLCDISAFRYWRLPPQVRALCPPLPRPEEDRQRYDLARNPTAAVALGFPLYTLVRSRNKRTCPASIRQRLFLGELPRESVLGTEHGVLITSPLLTAFIMLRHLTDLQLLLVLAEMCGLFAVCALPAALEAELSRAIDSGAISTTFGWVRCPSEDGTASNLWRRDALVLGGDTTSSPRARWTCRSTWSAPVLRFRSFHWRAQISPRRRPVDNSKSRSS